MSEPLVQRENRGPVAVLTLNRPEKRNALSGPLIDALSDLLGHVAVEPSVRVVVLTGAGPTFCAGIDLKEAGAAAVTAEGEKPVVDISQAFADLIDQVHRCPRPTIALLQGDAYGGGAGLALACDFLIAASGVRIGYPEVRRGLVASIVMHDLVRQVGDRRARSLLLTGEPLAAEEAERWGLVWRVVPADRGLAEAEALAGLIRQGAPGALATTKAQLDEATARPPDLRGAAAVSASVRIGAEAVEGIRAFLDDRPPRWAQP